MMRFKLLGLGLANHTFDVLYAVTPAPVKRQEMSINRRCLQFSVLLRLRLLAARIGSDWRFGCGMEFPMCLVLTLLGLRARCDIMLFAWRTQMHQRRNH